MVLHIYAKHLAIGVSGLVAGLMYQKAVYANSDDESLDDNLKYTNKLALNPIFKDVTKYGVPSFNTIRMHGGFVFSYDKKNKIAHWIMEHITEENVKELPDVSFKKRGEFFDDRSIREKFRSNSSDYKNSGYDRGHMARSANYNEKVNARATFVMSNVAPQNHNLNHEAWKNLEDRALKLADEHGSVYICCGPLFLPREVEMNKENVTALNLLGINLKNEDNKTQLKKFVAYPVIGENNVAVPTHFFKIIVTEKQNEEFLMESYIFSNVTESSNIPLVKYMRSRSEIEKAAGFPLFQNLPDSKFSSINQTQETEIVSWINKLAIDERSEQSPGL